MKWNGPHTAMQMQKKNFFLVLLFTSLGFLNLKKERVLGPALLNHFCLKKYTTFSTSVPIVRIKLAMLHLQYTHTPRPVVVHTHIQFEPEKKVLTWLLCPLYRSPAHFTKKKEVFLYCSSFFTKNKKYILCVSMIQCVCVHSRSWYYTIHVCATVLLLLCYIYRV